MKSVVTAFVSGLLFAFGLGMSGMTKPSKVLGFLDVAGNWDPSLLAVMMGAIFVFATCYRLIARRAVAWNGQPMQLPPKGKIDRRLVWGAIVFGIGWGLAGYCPGPAIVGLGAWAPGAGWFISGMFVYPAIMTIYEQRKRGDSTAATSLPTSQRP